MAISTTTSSSEQAGNGDPLMAYNIPFPFLDEEHIHVALIKSRTLGNVNSLAASGPGFTNYQVVLEQMEPAPDPEAGDMVLDANDRQGKIAGVTIHGGNTWTIRISNGDAFAATVGTQVRVRATKTLQPSEYSVTRLPDNSGGSVLIPELVPPSDTVSILREVPLVQPTEYQPAGPFPARSTETALDRLTMQIQQLHRRMLILERENDGSHLVFPVTSLAVYGTKIWNTDAERGSTAPDFVGQLGLQTSTGMVFRAFGTSVGAWADIRYRAWDRYQPVAPEVAIGTLSDEFVGTVPESGTLREVVFAVNLPGTVEMELTITTMQGVTISATMPPGAYSVSVPATDFLIAGDRIFISTTGDYGSPDATGLEVFFVSDRA